MSRDHVTCRHNAAGGPQGTSYEISVNSKCSKPPFPRFVDVVEVNNKLPMFFMVQNIRWCSWVWVWIKVFQYWLYEIAFDFMWCMKSNFDFSCHVDSLKNSPEFASLCGRHMMWLLRGAMYARIGIQDIGWTEDPPFQNLETASWDAMQVATMSTKSRHELAPQITWKPRVYSHSFHKTILVLYSTMPSLAQAGVLPTTTSSEPG